MAGTLTISTLSDGTNSTSATNPIMGSAKAWVNFNGQNTVAIRASYNVSSITDNGTGDYTVNMTNAMQDTNYSVNINATNPGTWLSGVSPFIATGSVTDAPPTTTAFRFVIVNSAPSALQDAKYVCVSVFR
jgi:hypothetical protein